MYQEEEEEGAIIISVVVVVDDRWCNDEKVTIEFHERRMNKKLKMPV